MTKHAGIIQMLEDRLHNAQAQRQEALRRISQLEVDFAKAHSRVEEIDDEIAAYTEVIAALSADARASA